MLEIPDEYQILLTFPWAGDPAGVAREVHAALARPAGDPNTGPRPDLG